MRGEINKLRSLLAAERARADKAESEASAKVTATFLGALRQEVAKWEAINKSERGDNGIAAIVLSTVLRPVMDALSPPHADRGPGCTHHGTVEECGCAETKR
jgi:hypothetical protein